MKAGFKVMGSINRFDYGLKWANALEAGGLVVADEVMITCNIELNAPKS
jgi:polyisoprenoid-binding protein YceI